MMQLLKRQSQKFQINTLCNPFLVKIFSIIAGSLLAFKIQLRLQSNVNAWDETTAQPTNKDHSFAVISLALWTSAIFGGRLIAYL